MSPIFRCAWLLWLVAFPVFAEQTLEKDFNPKPEAGQLLIWEFALDVDQHNRGAADEAPIESAGHGIGHIEYDTTTGTLRYQFNWTGLTGRVRDIELRGPAHPHQSTTRRLSTLARMHNEDGSEGHWSGEHELSDQTQPGFERLPVRSILTVMASGAAYVTVSTSAFETGEIRGNLGSAARMALP